VDHSLLAIEKAQRLAAERGVTVDYVASDASTYQPSGKFVLIITFFIQLFPEQRAAMLANISQALKPGGTLLFVSRDRSGSLSCWSEEDQLSLTDPEQIASELHDLRIQQASVLEDVESEHAAQENADYPGSRTTVVGEVRPGV